MKYWLFKSEPDCFSIDDLRQSKNGTASWDGVRNYQARNLLRDDVKKGDQVLFYYSNTDVPGVAGIAEVVRSGYPDHTARDPESEHFDPKATEDDPRWYMVDVKFKVKFDEIIPLKLLKETPGLDKMMVTQRGSRLSIQPVRKREWEIVLELAGTSRKK
jgi:predicted RNA-binding protein with PUA-like domain